MRMRMQKEEHRHGRGHTNLASCLVATIFLLFIAIITLILFFTLFKPKQPQISVTTVHIPSFSVTNGSVNFDFTQFVSIKNPNRAVFTHYDSSLQLVYSGNRVGFMFIPAGNIAPGQTQYLTANFAVEAFPMVPDGLDDVGPTLEIQSGLKMVGRVRVLHFFTHHVETRVQCMVAVSVTDGSVLGFHC